MNIRSALSPERRQPVVLVVEDEVLLRMSISEFLQDSGFTVLDASNAAEAQSILNSGHPVDVVLTDVQMPGDMDGFSLARWIRSNFTAIRVILTSGIARMAKDAADLCDYAEFVSKPYGHRELTDKIRAATAHKGRFSPAES